MSILTERLDEIAERIDPNDADWVRAAAIELRACDSGHDDAVEGDDE